jgi:pyridoxal phosphate enzyme (YggS family)
MGITEQYQKIREKIPEHVTIVLAAKTRTPEEVKEAIDAGVMDLGENYLQEAEQMVAMLGETAKKVRWHMIGDLQKNKINRALKVFDLVQTLSSFEKAEALNQRAAAAGKVMPVYVEINSGQEESKKGVDPDFEKVKNLGVNIAGLEQISVEGLMTMGPMTNNPEDSRPYFRKAKKFFDDIKVLDLSGVNLKTLSMGMSESYQVAIEEGSNMIRLGRMVFGDRVY